MSELKIPEYETGSQLELGYGFNTVGCKLTNSTAVTFEKIEY